MKILLCCLAGVTSNMFAAKLKDAAAEKGLDVIVWASANTAIEYSIDQADMVLVTPQLKKELHKIEDLAGSEVPVLLISDEDFATFNATTVLEEAVKLLG